MYKLLVLILTTLLFFYSCEESSDQDEPLEASTIDSELVMRSSSDHVFTRNPVFDYSTGTMTKITYEVHNNILNRTFSSSYVITDLIDYLLNKNDIDYYWKVLEDVKNLELQEFGSSQVTPAMQIKIDDTNDAMWEADAHINYELGCDESNSFMGIEYLNMRLEDDPWLFFGGRDCVEDRPQFQAWLELYEFQVPQDIEDGLPGNYEVQDFGDPFITWVPTNLDYYWIDLSNLTGANAPPFFQLDVRANFYTIDNEPS